METPPAVLQVTRELLERGLETPLLDTSPLPQYGYGQLDYGMTIGLERTPGGRLWACWVGGGDSEKGFFVLARSDDDGERWSDPQLVIDPHAVDLPCARRSLVGTLWTDPRGRLWLFFDQALTYFDGRAGDWYTRCDNPDAATPTWSPPQRIWHGCTLNKPTVLATDEWLLPISLWTRDRITAPFRDLFHDLDPLRQANVFVSRDEGASWQRRGGVCFPRSHFDEHMIIERRDGSLWMLARTADSLWESTSPDAGATWSPPRRSVIAHVSARFHLRRLRSGRLLLVKHGRRVDELTAGRSHLTAFLSDDDGQTWHGGLSLDERNGVSYPDATQAPDGTLYVSYDRNRATDGEILLARVTEADIAAGKLSTPRSRLGILISRPLKGRGEPPR
ncbi:MAG: exo-alpha-sialidase [Fimbriimonadaceae bacterium]|nr:exo-alpha-sialidase [Fimbriimonadaceae bacterium]